MKVSYTSAMVKGHTLGSQNPGLINTFPEEIILTIFENCKTALPALASVNRLWKQMTGTKAFYTAMFSPAFAALCFGKTDLKAYFGMDLGLDEVPHLHLKDYGDVEEGNCLLTYFPKEIPIENENGVISFVPPRANIIGELLKKQKCGYPISLDDDSWYFYPIDQEREIKGGEWVVTYKNPIGQCETFNAQVALAENQGKDTNVAELEKTIYTVFMQYVKTGEQCFPQLTIGDENVSMIRFQEKIANERILCSFWPPEIYRIKDNDIGLDYISVLVARKSTCT